MSALDWGGGIGVNTTPRYYTFGSPALPDSDWCIGMWLRRSSGPNFHSQYVFGIGNAFFDGFGLLLNEPGDGSTNAFQLTANNSAGASWVNASVGPAGQLAMDGSDVMIVVQRRANNLEFYVVAEGGTILSSGTVAAAISGTIDAGTGYLGWTTTFGGFDASLNPMGDFFIFNNMSLSSSQITGLAVGVSPTSIANPETLLQFRTGGNATEFNIGSGGSANDATRVSTGFTTTTEFYPLTPPAPSLMGHGIFIGS